MCADPLLGGPVGLSKAPSWQLFVGGVAVLAGFISWVWWWQASSSLLLMVWPLLATVFAGCLILAELRAPEVRLHWNGHACWIQGPSDGLVRLEIVIDMDRWMLFRVVFDRPAQTVWRAAFPRATWIVAARKHIPASQWHAFRACVVHYSGQAIGVCSGMGGRNE